MVKTTYNLLGRLVPFFLNNNNNLSDQYFLYQVYSPRLNKDLDPYVSLTKIAERTHPKMAIKENDIDLLRACTGNMNMSGEEACTYLKDILKKENPTIDKGDKAGEFPMTVLTDQTLVKNLIINLRHANRLKNYRLWPGRFVDILYNNEEICVFKICENADNVWLEPVNLYRMDDIGMKHPIPISNPDTIEYDRTKWSKKNGGISKISYDMLFAVKLMEWNSFGRRKKR